MSSRKTLPSEFTVEPFLVGKAMASGVGEGRLRSTDLERPFYGVRLVAGSAVDIGRNFGHFASLRAAEEFAAIVRRCLAYSLILKPGQHFSHITAARLWKTPLPTLFGPSEPLHISTIAPRRAPEGRGTVGHQTRAAVTTVVDRFGFAVSDPASTWVSLAPALGRDDLVAAGDHFVLDPAVLDPHDVRPHCSIADLERRIRLPRSAGAPAAAAAIALVRVGAESRPETLLRLLLIRAGFPEPELARDLYDSRGRWLARVDLYFAQWRVVVEYDGEQHRTSDVQYSRDEGRTESLVRADYTVVKVRKAQLFRNPNTAVERVANALHDRGWNGQPRRLPL